MTRLTLSRWFLTLALMAVLVAPLSAQPSDWGRYTNPDYGYQIDIPYGVFALVDDGRGKLSFEGTGGRSRLTIYGEENADQLALTEIADELARSSWISEVTYRKEGASWVVLSGCFRADESDKQIFYLKLMMSADRRRFAVFAVNYPQSEKARFDPVVDRLEASFRRPS